MPVKLAGDTSKQRELMTSRDADYGTSRLTSFGTPTQRHYYERHQQQQPGDRLLQVASLIPSTDDVRLGHQWNSQGRPQLWQKLQVSLVNAVALTLRFYATLHGYHANSYRG